MVFKQIVAKAAIGFSSYIKVFENTVFDHGTEAPIEIDESLKTLGVVKPPKELKVAEDVKVEAEKGNIKFDYLFYLIHYLQSISL